MDDRIGDPLSTVRGGGGFGEVADELDSSIAAHFGLFAAIVPLLVVSSTDQALGSFPSSPLRGRSLESSQEGNESEEQKESHS
ncbi:hypothetical protein TNCT_144251 [Trichonephila clavata]|uniref:Uncharacterized protein n=1 Tax=Trichonephila clavata TaxID=2740835 RepID=A0A8X6KPH4_TRICU|nr:hypothetical protein TNCT_144251 [Trichonephila clavata]